MTDTTDWKQKYRASLDECQAEADRWRHAEQILRRLIGRLCAAGMGVDPRLDDELRSLAAANRRNADAEELACMADSLTSAVVAVDSLAPVLASTEQNRKPSRLAEPPAGIRIKAAVAILLERLPGDSTQRAVKLDILTELKDTHGDEALAALVARAADMIAAHADGVARDRLNAASVLSEVTRRLEEMAAYLTESRAVSRQRYDDAQTHNESMMWQVQELTGEVGGATELGLLQTLIGTRLERITREICDFRTREECRLREYDGRAGQMAARIMQLERETQDLSTRLDGEKHRARLDPLTGVANRRAFDERFALAIARPRRGAAGGVIAIWDIDDFKLVNDTYGHRAGDRVLRSVAGCFKAAAGRDCDLAARIGGEEFALFLDAVAMPDARHVADGVRLAVETLRFHFRGTPVRITVSCGMTELQHSDTVEAAFDRADAALYRAKRDGKNLCISA